MGQTAEDLVTSLNSRDVQRRLQEYRALLANDSVGILAICDGEVMQCNPSAARLFGWEPERLLGQSAAVFFSLRGGIPGIRQPHRRCAQRRRLARDRMAHTAQPTAPTFWARLLVKSITPGGPGR